MEWRHIVFPQARLVYTSVAKAANTSVKTALMNTFVDKAERVHGVHGDHGLFTEVPEDDLPHGYLDHLRFTVVRNPFDRFVSFFTQKIEQREEPDRSLRRAGFHHGMTFAEACRVVAKRRDKGANPHFRSQHVVVAPGGRLIPSYIARFERLADDWLVLRAIVERTTGHRLARLPHRVRSQTRTGHYADYYDDDCRELVAKRYEDDLRLFGYRFGD